MTYIVITWGSTFLPPHFSSWASILYQYTLKPSYNFVLSSWYSDGPQLPLEFSRKCDDGSLSLVIDVENGFSHQSNWLILSPSNISESNGSIIDVLGEALHYDTSLRNKWIGFIDLSKLDSSASNSFIESNIIEWWNQKLNQRKTIENCKGIFYCNLTPNFENFSISQAITYLQSSNLQKSFETRILNSEVLTPLQQAILNIYKCRFHSISPGSVFQLYLSMPEIFTSINKQIQKKTFIGRNGYVEYIQGNLPIVLSIPHGGRLKPEEIPDRTDGVVDGDTNSIELGVELFSYLSHACSTNEKARIPHIIICHLHRIKLDANRNLEEAALGAPHAVEAWNEFHNFISIAKSKVLTQFKMGHYYDIHGNRMSSKVMLGYIIRKGDYDAGINTVETKLHLSSIRALIERKSSLEAKLDLLLGKQSLGNLLQSQGIGSVPVGYHTPYDWGGPEYWNGGYNTKRHGSSVTCYPIDGTQIETPISLRKESKTRRNFANILSKSILQFFQIHYNLNLTS